MIKCIKYSPINKKTCLGVATIFVEKWGIEIYGITLHQKDGKRWINFPSRKYEDKETGEMKYLAYFRFPEKDHYIKFCDAVKSAIDEYAKENSNDGETYE